LRIAFAAASARVDDDARARLATLAHHAAGARLLVIGHSDADGSRANNHRLALARAERVAAQLQALGVTAVEVEADAADSPVASNTNAAGRRQNRRADVYILAR